MFSVPNTRAQDMLERRWNNLEKYAIEKAEEYFKKKVSLKSFYEKDKALSKNETLTITIAPSIIDKIRTDIKEVVSESNILGEVYFVVADGAVLLHTNFKGQTYRNHSGKFWALQISPFDDNDKIEFKAWLDDVSKCNPCNVKTGGFFIINDSR